MSEIIWADRNIEVSVEGAKVFVGDLDTANIVEMSHAEFDEVIRQYQGYRERAVVD